MQPEAAKLYVLALYEHLLKRHPAEAELEHWTKVAEMAVSAETVYYSFIKSEEFKQRNRVLSLFPSGHYYSPVVDPGSVEEYVKRERATQLDKLAGISISLDSMEEFWYRSQSLIAATPFPETRVDGKRFYYDNNIFPYGDAISLRAMLASLRPRSVVEIGSGFSSACMLDCADEFDLNTEFTFIDPNSERLNKLLQPNDAKRVNVINDQVQNVDLDQFRKLRPGDVLFIDSTHVLKTGSDVHYELFHVLPSLSSGVLIHFHDIQFPFEYPDQWIFRDNHSWNEIYALRAFLMYNNNFRIRFWGSCFAHLRANLVRQVLPLFLKNPGGSIWIEKI